MVACYQLPVTSSSSIHSRDSSESFYHTTKYHVELVGLRLWYPKEPEDRRSIRDGGCFRDDLRHGSVRDETISKLTVESLLAESDS